MVENRRQPTTVHLKTYVDKRYKLTVYYLNFARRARKINPQGRHVSHVPRTNVVT